MLRYLGYDPNRATQRARDLLYRDPLSVDDLIQVMLIVDDTRDTGTRVPSYHISDMKTIIPRMRSVGLTKIKIFTQEVHKDHLAAHCASSDNMTARVVKEIRDIDDNIFITTETCLCPYTQDGSCGLHYHDGRLDVATTIELFGEMALMQAECGVDAIGPAAMIEGTIRRCRTLLDANGFHAVGIMPHMIFRSPFYHLYRAVMGTGAGGPSRPSFQIDPYSATEAQRALKSLELEGASAILTEPALFLLDLFPPLRSATTLPLGCFSVSGEYELLRYGSDDPQRSTVGAIEFCRAAKRGGCNYVATYAALEIAESLNRGEVYHAR